MADLIARSGVSRKTFYEHFADKEECFLAAHDAAAGLLMGGVTAAYEAEQEWVDAIRAALTAFLGFLAAHPHLTRLCIVDVHAVGARGLARPRRGRARLLPLPRRRPRRRPARAARPHRRGGHRRHVRDRLRPRPARDDRGAAAASCPSSCTGR